MEPNTRKNKEMRGRKKTGRGEREKGGTWHRENKEREGMEIVKRTR